MSGLATSTSSSLSWPPPARRSRRPTAGLIAAALLGVAACVALALLPWTYPGEDARFALAWGDELGRLHVPDFDGPVPAKHPLTLLVGIALAPLAASASILAYGAVSFAGFFLAGYAVFRLARALGGVIAGGLAVAIALSRPEVIEQVATGGKDLPFVALVLIAVAIVVEDGNFRPIPVLGLLALAGLIRPEAWPLAIVFWLWLLRDARREALAPAAIALALAAPLIWIGTDLLLTGDPLQTLHHAQERPAEIAAAGFGPEGGSPSSPTKLERLGDALESGLPGAIGWAAIVAAGLAVAARLAERRGSPLRDRSLGALVLPLLIAVAVVGATIVVVVAGLRAPDRFLLLAALALLAVATSAVADLDRSRIAMAAVSLLVVGTLVALPGDIDDSREILVEREDTRELGDGQIELAERPTVDTAIDVCPRLAFGGDSRANVSLGQVLAALATGRDVSDFELGRRRLLQRDGSAFGIRTGLADSRTAEAVELNRPWEFASRC